MPGGATKATIVNAALYWLGQPASVGEDDTDKVPRRLYAALPERAARMLEDGTWTWARKTAQLTASEPTPNGWAYGFPEPGDCARIVQVDSRADMWERTNIDYDLREGRILTGSDTTWLNYVSRDYVNLIGAWPATARDALALDLADHVGSAIDLPTARHDMIAQRAVRAMRAAKRLDAQEGTVKDLPRSRWQNAHYSTDWKGGRNG